MNTTDHILLKSFSEPPFFANHRVHNDDSSCTCCHVGIADVSSPLLYFPCEDLVLKKILQSFELNDQG